MNFKKTALALCITLPLNLDQVNELLASAGYVLSKSNKFDKFITLVINSYQDRNTLLSISKIDYTLYELGLETFGKSN